MRFYGSFLPRIEYRGARSSPVRRSCTVKGINSDLVADLTWSELYIAKIRQNLKILTPAAKNTATASGSMKARRSCDISLRAPIARPPSSEKCFDISRAAQTSDEQIE
jgi:hypothetical protein